MVIDRLTDRSGSEPILSVSVNMTGTETLGVNGLWSPCFGRQVKDVLNFKSCWSLSSPAWSLIRSPSGVIFVYPLNLSPFICLYHIPPVKPLNLPQGRNLCKMIDVLRLKADSHWPRTKTKTPNPPKSKITRKMIDVSRLKAHSHSLGRKRKTWIHRKVGTCAKWLMFHGQGLIYGVFPLPDSDSYSDTDTDKNRFNSNVQKCFHWT